MCHGKFGKGYTKPQHLSTCLKMLQHLKYDVKFECPPKKDIQSIEAAYLKLFENDHKLPQPRSFAFSFVETYSSRAKITKLKSLRQHKLVNRCFALTLATSLFLDQNI